MRRPVGGMAPGSLFRPGDGPTRRRGTRTSGFAWSPGCPALGQPIRGCMVGRLARRLRYDRWHSDRDRGWSRRRRAGISGRSAVEDEGRGPAVRSPSRPRPPHRNLPSTHACRTLRINPRPHAADVGFAPRRHPPARTQTKTDAAPRPRFAPDGAAPGGGTRFLDGIPPGRNVAPPTMRPRGPIRFSTAPLRRRIRPPTMRPRLRRRRTRPPRPRPCGGAGAPTVSPDWSSCA